MTSPFADFLRALVPGAEWERTGWLPVGDGDLYASDDDPFRVTAQLRGLRLSWVGTDPEACRAALTRDANRRIAGYRTRSNLAGYLMQREEFLLAVVAVLDPFPNRKQLPEVPRE